MRYLVAFLLRVGRSDDERVSLLGDLEEERRARRARGSSRLAVFAWSASEISRAFFWGLRDAFVRLRQGHGGRAGSFFSWPDLKLSLRLLIRNPGLTVVSTIGLTVGIAIPTGAVGFFQANFDPDLPLDEGNRIVALENWDTANNNENRRSLHDFLMWRDQMTSVVEISAFSNNFATMQTGDHVPETVRFAAMSASGFRVARVPALFGRFLTPDDEREGAPPVVVIGYDVWRSRFDADRSVIGQKIRFGATQYAIVGVMPEGFAFPINHQYWIPLRLNPASTPRGSGPVLFVFGRLAPGATRASAQVELAVLGQRAAALFPATNATLKPQVLGYTMPINDIQDLTVGAWVMGQLVVSLVLVVVALNVAILIYARTANRAAEIALRTALGANRGRIVTQLFIEALVLAVVPALAGLALGQYAVEMGNRLQAADMYGATPFWWDHRVQPVMMLYVLGLVVFTAAVAGILPALHATRRQSGADLRQLGGSTRTRLGRMWSALIVVQVACAVAFLPAAIKSGITEIRTSLTQPNYPVEEFVGAAVGTEGGSSLLGNRLLELRRRLLAEPEVAGVTVTGFLPQRNITGLIEFEGITMEGAPAPGWSKGLRTFGVDTEYFDVYGLRVLAGRPFNALDPSTALGANAVIVDQAFVQRFLPSTTAVGRRMRYASPKGPPAPWYEIVGVVENLQRNPIDPGVLGPTVLYPVAPEQLPTVSLAVRLRGSAAARMQEGFARKVFQTVSAIDPTLRMSEVQTRVQSDSEDALALRLVTLALSCVLVTVLLFSAAGVYALMSFTVSRRRREIGIRMALGASSAGVLRSVFSRVAVQVGMGVVLGTLGAMVIAPVGDDPQLAARLAIVTPVIALIMVVVGVVAAYGPARRSLRIQPTEAVRAE
jgi:predicted permease